MLLTIENIENNDEAVYVKQVGYRNGQRNQCDEV